MVSLVVDDLSTRFPVVYRIASVYHSDKIASGRVSKWTKNQVAVKWNANSVPPCVGNIYL